MNLYTSTLLKKPKAIMASQSSSNQNCNHKHNQNVPTKTLTTFHLEAIHTTIIASIESKEKNQVQTMQTKLEKAKNKLKELKQERKQLLPKQHAREKLEQKKDNITQENNQLKKFQEQLDSKIARLKKELENANQPSYPPEMPNSQSTIEQPLQMVKSNSCRENENQNRNKEQSYHSGQDVLLALRRKNQVLKTKQWHLQEEVNKLKEKLQKKEEDKELKTKLKNKQKKIEQLKNEQQEYFDEPNFAFAKLSIQRDILQTQFLKSMDNTKKFEEKLEKYKKQLKKTTKTQKKLEKDHCEWSKRHIHQHQRLKEESEIIKEFMEQHLSNPPSDNHNCTHEEQFDEQANDVISENNHQSSENCNNLLPKPPLIIPISINEGISLLIFQKFLNSMKNRFKKLQKTRYI